jgi:hypothetical protein
MLARPKTDLQPYLLNTVRELFEGGLAGTVRQLI